MRSIVLLATILFTGPALGDVGCAVQGGYLICNTLSPLEVAVATPTMSLPTAGMPDYSADASYQLAAAGLGGMQADTATLYSAAVTNPYESLDTVDPLGSTTAVVCATGADPNSGC